jgi:CHAD domain-containing protein
MNKGTKSLEIELKLVLPGPEAEKAVVAYLSANGYSIEEIEPVRNVDTYLDTFDWSLLKNDLGLRYRLSNGTGSYTLKSIGGVKDGIARRLESVVPVKNPVEEPAAIPWKPIGKLVDGMLFPRKLLEQIQVRTDRRRYRVISPEAAEIELAFDTSSLSLRGLHKPRRTRKLHELEAEILKGPETALGVLASLLASQFGFGPSAASKLEVAMERFKVSIPSKKPPEHLRVRLDDRFDLAVRKILTDQFHRFREQLPGVCRDIDTEFVHQARVATRRMRSALRLFRGAVPERCGGFLAGELQWLGGMLGDVRDLDVFLLNLSRFEGQIESFPGKKKQAFENWIERNRRAPWKALCQALASPRIKQFERRLARFLERPLPLHPRSPLAMKPVREVAPLLIMEKFDAVIEQGRTVLAKPKLKQFHRLRIQMKRLRYACEFLSPAYDGALDPLIERTVEIQDCLGELQDTVFTKEFVASLREDWQGKLVDPDLLFILGEIYQLQAEIARERRERFGKIWERFSSEESILPLKKILSLPPPLDQSIE